MPKKWVTGMMIIMLVLVLYEQGLSAPFSYDVAWTFGNVGSSSYRLDAFDAPGIEFGEIGSQDPTLPLEL